MKPGTTTSYVTGFILSVLLTLTAYIMVAGHWLSGGVLIAGLVALALIQLAVQLLLFLHLANETGPRWKLLAFGFMVLVVIILVLGSLWIMNNLDYHMTTPMHLDRSIIEDEGIH